jgi:hypothetical protein
MDDAANEHYSLLFVDKEGTASSFQGVRYVIVQKYKPSFNTEFMQPVTEEGSAFVIS